MRHRVAIKGNMARSSVSVGRRRRVLNEEVLAGGNATRRSARMDENFGPGDTPRYGAGANIENHPQITDFVPRRYRIIGLIIALGLFAGTLAELSAHYASQISDRLGAVSAAEIVATMSDRLVAWSSATILLVTAVYARMLFNLRRHRVDDYRGSYRLWRLAGWAAVALSFNAVVGGHLLLARVLGQWSGWQLLPESVGWWLVPTGIIGGWLLTKLTFDARESRSALLAYILAFGCFTAAGVASAGGVPASLAVGADTLCRALALAGNVMLLAGTLLFVRYVVLDVQGLIDHPLVDASSEANSGLKSKSLHRRDQLSAQQRAATEKDERTNGWVDAAELEQEEDQHGQHRLSKAERKRLRKQKNRNRAA